MERFGIGYIGWLTVFSIRRQLPPSRVAIDETAVKINEEWSWV
jgi:transposase-like protein